MASAFKAGNNKKKRHMAPKYDSKQDAALYIERMSVELRDLADAEGYDVLVYLLDMARLEAASVSLRTAQKKASR